MFTLYNWAETMSKVISSIVPNMDFGLGGMGSSDGEHLLVAQGKAIIEAFKKAGYRPYEQIDQLWVIDCLDDDKHGVIVDFREEMTDDKTECLIMFFNDNF